MKFTSTLMSGWVLVVLFDGLQYRGWCTPAYKLSKPLPSIAF